MINLKLGLCNKSAIFPLRSLGQVCGAACWLVPSIKETDWASVQIL